MKKLISILVIVSLLMLMAGVISASAERDEPKVYDHLWATGDEYVSDEIIVKYKDDDKPFKVVKIPEGKVREKVKEFRKQSEVELAEPNYIAHAMEVNDPYFSYQWNLRSQAEGGIRANEAWSTANGSGVIVAIVDTGIAYENHTVGQKTYYKAPDLANT